MELSKMKVAELRKLAEEQGVEGFEDLDRKGLIVALEPQENEQDEKPAPEKEPEAPKVAEVNPLLEKSYAPVGSKAHAMKLKLQSETKVRVFIPLASGEKQGVTQSVILNGYPLYIRKGEYVEVPQSVAEVLEIKMKHKMLVENHPSRIGGDREVKMTTYGSN